jgi:magnesium transporter
VIRSILEWNNPSFEWIDVENPTADNFTEVARKFSLHPTSIQDCLDPEHHPKYERIENSDFFIIRTFDRQSDPKSDTIEELTRKIAIFIKDGKLLTIHRAENLDLRKLADKWSNALPMKDLPTWNLVNEVIRASLRTFDAPLDEMDREIGRLESNFFSKQGLAEQTPLHLEKIYVMKRKLGVVRRNFRLTMDALSKLGLADQSKIPFIQDVREEAESYYYYTADMIESLNNLANVEISLASHETNIASHETNEVIRFLTIYSIFFMPLNLIVGFFGMNITLPLAHKNEAAFLITGLMVLLSLSIYAWFWRIGWIRHRKR